MSTSPEKISILSGRILTPQNMLTCTTPLPTPLFFVFLTIFVSPPPPLNMPSFHRLSTFDYLKVLEKCTKNLIGHSRLAFNNHESNIDC